MCQFYAFILKVIDIKISNYLKYGVLDIMFAFPDNNALIYKYPRAVFSLQH